MLGAQLSADAWIPRTKLVMPRPGRGVVFDPVLLGQLRATTSTLTLITAQAGSGKTTLAATLAGDLLPATPAWISLDEGDDDLGIVLHLLWMALDPVLPSGCPSLRDLLSAGLPAVADARQAVGVLINDLLAADPEPVLLVLDDLHVITDPDALTALGYLLDHAPAHLRVLATARTEPRVGIARRRTHGRLTEVGVADLRFDADRATTLLNDRLELGLSPAQVERAVEASGGWVVGVRLLGEALARGGDGPQVPAGSAALYDFLADEILSSHPEHVQDFLLDTSVLDDLDGPTCQAVSRRDDASALLETLHCTLSFLVLATGSSPDGDGGYRYHDLFRGFLRRRLEQDPRRAVEQHRRAAEVVPDPTARIEHLIAAAEHAAAAAEIVRLARSTSAASVIRRLAGLVARLDSTHRNHPWLRTITGLDALGRGHRVEATDELEAALEAFPPEDRLGQWVVARHLHNATGDHARFAPLFGRMEREPDFALLPAVTRLDHHLGRAYGALHTGNWEEASRRLGTALQLGSTSGSIDTAEVVAQHLSPLLVACDGGVELTESYLASTRRRFPDPTPLLRLGIEHQTSIVCYLRGRMDEAVAAAERAGNLPERLGGLPYLRATLTWVSAGAAYAAGRVPVASTVLDDAAASPATELDHTLGVPRLALRARIARLRNDRSALEQLESELAARPQSVYAERLRLAEVSVQAQAAWAARELDRAEDILRSGLPLEERLRLVPGVGSLRLDLAMVLADAGRPTESMRELGVVLTAAEHRGWVGRLVEAGPEVMPLLELGVKRGVGAKPAAEALELLRGSAHYATTSVPGTDEVLSAREMEVLALLAEGASNADLAARLFVSVNTAKTHVGRILTKLDARSRTEAVARARALHLL